MKQIHTSRMAFSFIVFLLITTSAHADWKWLNPQQADFPVVQGQGWPVECAGSYVRLPLRAKKQVREPLWNLALDAAGLSIHFRTTSHQLKVRYTVNRGKAMEHMPATGVSGLDLYLVDEHGHFERLSGRRIMGDTIVYTFASNGKLNAHAMGSEYRLMLPLYNSVEWMEIGVEADRSFEFFPVRKEKPIVVYGTSIAQGACASRPGMAWTNILGRKMDVPVVNLGFSGNGKLEPELIALMGELDASVYVLDCLPNLGDLNSKLVSQKLIEAVSQLRQLRPNVPILLVEHPGYSDMNLQSGKRLKVTEPNIGSQRALEAVLSRGEQNIYYLSKEELNLPPDGFVDDIHPTDWGMMVYATAYEKKLREILHQPAGKCVTTIPVSQNRDANTYDWQKRHEATLEENGKVTSRMLLIGNSITHFWAGDSQGTRQWGLESWNRVLKPLGARNMGCGWDRIENVLWRVYHGELDGYQAERIVLMIGTNNLLINTDEEIIDGLKFLVAAIRQRQPTAAVKVVGILPRRGEERRVKTLNKAIQKMSREITCAFTDAGGGLLLPSGLIDESLFSDGLHPNGEGYGKIVDKVAE